MTAPYAQPTAKKPRPRWLRILIIVGVVLVALIIIGAIFGPKKDAGSPTAGSPASSSASSSAPTSATSSAAAQSTEEASVTTSSQPAPATGPVVVSTLPNGALLSEMGTLRPNAVQEQALLAQLGAVDENFGKAKYADRYVGRAVSLCDYIRDNPDATPDMVRTRAIAEFKGGTVPNISTEQGDQLVVATTSTFCVPA